jgi:hypothetical protein
MLSLQPFASFQQSPPDPLTSTRDSEHRAAVSFIFFSFLLMIWEKVKAKETSFAISRSTSQLVTLEKRTAST